MAVFLDRSVAGRPIVHLTHERDARNAETTSLVSYSEIRSGDCGLARRHVCLSAVRVIGCEVSAQTFYERDDWRRFLNVVSGGATRDDFDPVR